MPRVILEPRHHAVPYLSVLAPDGSVDEELEPELDEELFVALHRTMLLARRFDERLLTLQRQGSIGTFAPVTGQEAANLGPASCLEEDDWMVPSFRETAAQLWRGVPMEQVLLYAAGFNEGAAVPEGGRTLPNAVPVATQLPHAVGIAYATRLRDEDDVTLVFFGDGATSGGDFHEALNFAALWRAPVVFLCQNNQYAISLPREEQTRSSTLAQKALAYGMPGIQVDGNDLLATRLAAQEAFERARAGDGPTLVECVTYRLEMHTTADDPTRYRDDEEVEAWREKDPLPRLQGYLRGRGVLDEERLDGLEEDVEAEIDAAWERAAERIDELQGEPESMFEHLLAEPPPYLERQREAYVRDRDGHRDEGRGA